MPFEYENMPGCYKDILMLAHMLHRSMIPHELSMTAYNGWCIEIYPLGGYCPGRREFVLIQDDHSKKKSGHDIEFITDSGTEILDDDGCFDRIQRWWTDEYGKSQENDA